MNRGIKNTAGDRWQRLARWFLFLSYAIGAPVFAVFEFDTGRLSERLNYPPEFLYLVSGIEFVCALLLLAREFAPWSAMVLTVLTLGAVASHFRIGSPVTALPAAIYTVIQVWYGLRAYRQRHNGAN